MDDIQERIETARAYLSKFQQAAHGPNATDEDMVRYERSRRILAEAERDEQRQRAGALERRCRELEKSAASTVNAKKKTLTAREQSEELAEKVFGKS